MVNSLSLRRSWTALQRFSQWLFVLPCTSTSSWKQIVPAIPLRVFSIVRWNIPDAFFIPWGSLSNLKKPSVLLMTQISCAASSSIFGNKQMISQPWRKTLILPAREIMFLCREEGSLQSWSYRLHELWSLHKAEKICLLPLPLDWRSIHDTSWIDWGDDSLRLKFRQFYLDLVFHGKWNFPSATENRFGVMLQFDSGFNSFNCRQDLYIRQRRELNVINSGHVSADQPEFFLGLNICNINALNFFPMGSHTSDDKNKAFCVHHMLQSIGG